MHRLSGESSREHWLRHKRQSAPSPKPKCLHQPFHHYLRDLWQGLHLRDRAFPWHYREALLRATASAGFGQEVTITLNLASARQPWNFSAHEAAVGTGHVQKWLGKVLSIQHSGTPQWIAATLLWGQENKRWPIAWCAPPCLKIPTSPTSALWRCF